MSVTSKREVRQIKARELRVGNNDKGQRTLSGYAAVFNSLSCDMGGWFEIVSSSAFTRTLQDSPDVLCLYSHDASLVLGRTKSETLTLSVDATGLRFECVLPDTSTANDLIVSIERGDVDGCSFGFVCNNDVWTEDSEFRIVRTLLDVTLFEVTITAAPAYTATSVSLRSAPKEIRSKITRRDDMADEEMDSMCQCTCDACQNGDCADCTNDDCTDPACTCPDSEIDERSIRNKMEMRLILAKHRLT